MSTAFDAYRTLQVAPHAEDIVVESAHRALAGRYRPDGPTPDMARMAEINRAYDLLRTPIRRRRYDREHNLMPVGPGAGSVTAPDAGTAARGMGPGSSEPSPAVIDFGRYQGWNLRDLAQHDPDYLRWLARSSGGIRYRHLIRQVLPDEGPLVGA